MICPRGRSSARAISAINASSKRPRMGLLSLKPKSQTNLHRPRSAALKDRRQTAPRAPRSEHQIEHRARLSEQGTGNISHRVGEVRVIEGIESFDPQLNRFALAREKLTPQREIEL